MSKSSKQALGTDLAGGVMKIAITVAAIAAALALSPTAAAAPGHAHFGPQPHPAAPPVSRPELYRLLFGPPQAPVPAPTIPVADNAPTWMKFTSSVIDELIYRNPLPNHPWVIVVPPVPSPVPA